MSSVTVESENEECENMAIAMRLAYSACEEQG
jgi:hypothetical protein